MAVLSAPGWGRLPWQPLGLLSVLIILHTASYITATDRHLDSQYLHRERRQIKFATDDDGWTEWGEESLCSRDCGIGVTYRERSCTKITEDGSPLCLGPSRHYATCNVQDCSEGTPDFRLEQCQRYNNVSFDGNYYEWVPYYGGEHKCELKCLAKGEKFYYRHAAKVKDGTRCDVDALDICIDGVCQEVGCDKKLGSKMKNDKCQQCGGDGSTCTTHGGYLDTQDIKSGYNDLILIPAGAMSLNFEETRPGNNYLALRDAAGNYLLNGDWQIHTPQPFKAAGTTFHYKRGAHPSDEAETLRAEGPLTEQLFFVVLKQPGQSPQVSYEYSLPASIELGSSHSYTWVTDHWGHCSHTCGKGEQTRGVTCQRTSDGETAADDLCDPVQRPSNNRTCQVKACPASWHVGYWEPCSTTCGEGVSVRAVFCQRREKKDLFSIVPAEDCKEKRPLSIKKCNADVKCPNWQVGTWSQCNRVCGIGQQTRAVYCQARHPLPNAVSDILPHNRCDSSEEPISAQECNMGPCDGLEWVASTWSGCLGECGHMMETRRVVCSSKVGEVFNDTMCDESKRPATTRPCSSSDASCHGHTQWHASQWSQCSAMCGPGIQSREVTCVRVEDGVFVREEDSLCDALHKMHDTRNCTGESCWGIWFTGPWGKCSSRCGSGSRKRDVLCFYGDQVATSNDCDVAMKPSTDELCNVEPCDEENAVEGCKNSEFGCCPDEVTAAEGPAFAGCPAKDPIPTGLCIETEYGCCLDGITSAQGPFNYGCPYFTCKDMAFGCCPDGQTPAAGPSNEGCPEVFGCAVTAYGCCPDGVTSANGFNNEGCEEPLKTCHDSHHGCCPDGITEAAGPEMAGCDTDESSGQVCEESTFGCCPDHITPASGPNHEGCNEIPSSCGFSLYGCCPDGATAAEGPDSVGCPGVIFPPSGADCSFTTYGCCPDGETAALGPGNYGCHSVLAECEDTSYGCCPDGESVALGFNFEGCAPGCETSAFGCCMDGITPASGPGFVGCEDHLVLGGCAGTRHGCCPDNKTSAHGPFYQGCNVTRFEPECDMTTFGCCMDGETVAVGPDFSGCKEEGTYIRGCLNSPYGCCPDEVSAAEGPDNAGCPSLINKGAACALPSDTGSCSDYEVKWYFDPLVGECTRFWYGGCDGNENRFENREECQTSCIKPEGIQSCYLPKSVGRCRASEKRWFYNSEDRECEEFTYGGCLGNDNRFESHSSCEEKCIAPQSPDVCSQPHMPGPCRGNFERWFYDKSTGQCRQFIYGGCLGNENRFETQEQCEQRCQQPATTVCQLPMDTGPCRGSFRKYFFDPELKQCREFVYGGCHGNANKFSSMQECQSVCHELLKKVVDVCTLPKDSGPCYAYMERWYFDAVDGYCKEFVYGGCEGNGNSFESEDLCRSTCNAKAPLNVCEMSLDSGPCEAYSQYYGFDSTLGKCTNFVYGGCEGNGNRFSTLEECEKKCPATSGTDVKTHTDVCKMEVDAGPCYAYVTRFHYDHEQDECFSFTFGGCQGNGNNFGTLEECRAQCSAPDRNSVLPVTEPVEPADKPVNLPIPSPPGPRTRHNRQAPSSALPIKHPATDACKQPLQPGTCKARIPRFYFDSERQRCLPFSYGGCHGNDNNFHTREECEEECPSHISGVCNKLPEKGPCHANLNRYFFDADDKSCRPFIFGGCLGNGNNFLTVTECQIWCLGYTTDICSLPREAGPCGAYHKRYAYEPNRDSCVPFIYGGCKGNANNFATLGECKTRCSDGGKHYIPGITDVCNQDMNAGPCYDWESRYFFNKTTSRCEHFFYGGCEGNGNNFETEEECSYNCLKHTTTTPSQTRRPHPRTHPEHERTQPTKEPVRTHAPDSGHHQQISDICFLEKDAGPCYSHQTKFYFDHKQGICAEFTYGGCLGNHNNFVSQEECQAYCGRSPVTTRPPTPTDVCTEPRDPGPCYASLTRFYYDPTVGRCLEFTFGGCEGNNNNFASDEECQNRCGGRAPTVVSPTGSTDRCQLPKEPGPCLAYLPRYFYDGSDSRCKQFIYGGCGGNRNRFMSEEDCREMCTATTPPPDTHTDKPVVEVEPEPEPTQPTETQEPVGRCDLPLDPGTCSAYIPRWFYNQTIDECIIFVYQGCGGNDNKFTMKSLCEKECSQKDVCQLSKNAGECRGYIPSWYYDHVLGRCQQFIYGGCGGNNNRFETIEECQNRCSPPTKKAEEPTEAPITGIAICGMRSDPGPCRESVQKWYFDYEQGVCQQFIYGGCRGNENKFDTKAACLQNCNVKEICTLPSETGPCRASKRRYFYNHHSKECQLFTYGGCQGNANRFLTKENCETVCSDEGPIEPLRPGEETDVCTLSVDAGPCAAYQPHWYYDILSDTCEQFIYGGCLGNGNRFATEDACVQRCEPRGVRTEAPRTSGTDSPRSTRTEAPRTRTEAPRTRTEAPWTRTAAPPVRTPEPWAPTTLRPRVFTEAKEGDVCGLLKDPGPCTDYNPVWYFEPNTRTCRRFLYGGCEGNGNKFETRYNCEAACLYEQVQTTVPPTYHPHTTEATSVEYDVCSLSSDAGPCRDNITVKWYFNDDAGQCQRFLYGGCEGNANRFETEKDCKKICILRPKKDVCKKPADNGPCNDTLTRWFFNHKTQICEQFTYGGCQGNGNRFESELECHQTCGAEQKSTVPKATEKTTEETDSQETHIDQTHSKDTCTLSPEAGPCKAAVRKWYFDTHYDRCLEFTYGGCAGNENRFETEADCQERCGGSSVEEPAPENEDICDQPVERGPCFADYLRFFYDKSLGECRPFIYGGCQANDNSFESQEDCYSRCGDPLKEPHIRKPGDCYLAPDQGPCRAAIKRFHFDPAQGDCVAFYYGGCEGNGNNFVEYTDCLAMCSKATVSCGVLSCDLQCEYGFARGPDGCPKCKCADPCEGHRCQEGYECQVQQVQCVAEPCPAQAFCVPKPKEGTCPPPEWGPFCPEECHTDMDCPGWRKCCNNGCGLRCRDPEPVYQEPKEGECPHLDVELVGSCDRPCETDYDCQGADKCCDSPCGAQCSAPKGPAVPLPRCPVMVEGELATTNVKLCIDDSSCPHDGRCCTNSGLGQVCIPASDLPGCARSVFGCCLDGVSNATGYNYRGCPEEEPMIVTAEDGQDRMKMSLIGATLILTCRATGAPKPQITWYKNGFPVLADDTGRYIDHEDGSLEIRQMDRTDAADFTCRAYNGVGTSATKTYTVTVHEPVRFGEMQSIVSAQTGETVTLRCVAYGNPRPDILWLRGGTEVYYDGFRVTQEPDDSLVIRDIGQADQGDYVCEASNGIGAVEQRIIVVNVIDIPPTPGPMTVILTANNDTHQVGSDVRLMCLTTGDGDIRTSWSHDDQPVYYDDRVKTTAEGELLIEDVVPEDQGVYRCTATRGDESIYAETAIRVAGLSLPFGCSDKPWLANCALIVQARLCRHRYFSDFCCKSCHTAGLLP